jgi:RimJ/RimL family protein N-acetyltransferase
MTIDVRQLSEAIVLRNGTPALLRAIRPDDRNRLAKAFLALEPESVYLRYFSFKHELTPADLDRLCEPDFRERVVLVVTIGSGTEEVVIGAGGYVAHAAPRGQRVAEVAFAVEEDFHGEGIASKLLALLVDIARQDNIDHFEADVLTRNLPMLQVFARSGLPMQRAHNEEGVVSVSMALAPNPAGASR